MKIQFVSDDGSKNKFYNVSLKLSGVIEDAVQRFIFLDNVGEIVESYHKLSEFIKFPANSIDKLAH